MGTRGITTAMRMERGTFRPHKHGGPELVPKPGSVEDLVAPESLKNLGLELWNLWFPELVGLGVITVVDVPAFQKACEIADKVEELDSIIESEGWTYENPRSGSKLANPHIAIRQKYMNEYLHLMDKFGLVPVSRQKIQMVPQQKVSSKAKFKPLGK